MFNSKSDFTTHNEAASNIMKTDPLSWKTHYQAQSICIRLTMKFLMYCGSLFWETVSIPQNLCRGT